MKRFFSFSLLSAVSVVSCAYLILLQSILTPACNSSSLAFLMMCSAYKLKKQGDRKQICCTSYSFLKLEPVSCPIQGSNSILDLHTVFSGQVRWSAITICLRVFHRFFFMILTVKGFSVVTETEVDVFSRSLLLSLWPSKCWQYDVWFFCLF